MAKGSKAYTYAEVLTHGDRKDCWVVINGKVYDLTRFLDDHPGGDDVILTSAGIDASNDFNDTGHSSTAIAMMDEFCVGDLDTSSGRATPKFAPLKDPLYGDKKKTSDFIRFLQFLVPLIVLVYALGTRFYAKPSINSVNTEH